MLRGSTATNSYAVVIALGRAHNDGHSSTVYCLKLASGKVEEIRVCGRCPFRLANNEGRYIWNNDELRERSIEQGSVLQISGISTWGEQYESLKRFIANTGETVMTSEVLSQLSFGDGDHAVAYHGISAAFPKAVIAKQGIYQNFQKPLLPYALISVQAAWTCDDRIMAITRLGEVINLNNRSRGLYRQGTTDVKKLAVRKPIHDNDVASIILVTFGSKTAQQNFQAVCEAILLQEIPGSISAEPEVDRYPMSHQPRGLCLIINNMCFEKSERHRFGAERDEEALRCLFEEKLHFEVHVRNDLKNCEMEQTCEEFAAKDHRVYDAFVCIIMSHGDRDQIEGINGKRISLENLMCDFKAGSCPSLAGKPKLFFIQACRGAQRDELMLNSSGFVDGTVFGIDSTICRSICPQEIDFLLAFATTPGYVAHREQGSGSVFIQTLVDVMKKHHETEHVLDMLTKVTRLVADKHSQVPAPVSTLAYKLYL